MTETLGPLLPDELNRLAAAVMTRIKQRNQRVSTAESCTGGLLAALLTDVEGASSAFACGFVTYGGEAKIRLLGVPAGLVDRHGAVSREVAVAMAEGGRAAAQAELCLAVTGFTGAAGQGEEAGLVHLACAAEGQPTRHREAHFGDVGRGPARIAALRSALELLDASL